jgi:KTSC domain-containing protein
LLLREKGNMSQIELVPVQSSRIAAIGYRAENCTLAIRFPATKKAPAGKIYHYKEFSPEQWSHFRSAASFGEYFAKYILNNPQHPFSCVDNGSNQPIEDAQTTIPEGKSMSALDLSADATSLRRRAFEVSREARGMAIHSAIEFEEAAKRLKQLVLEKKQAQLRVNQIKTPAYQTYKATLQLEKDVIAPYTQAEQWLKGGMARYLAEEESVRRKREESLTAQAQSFAEEEARQQAVEFAEFDALALEAQGDSEHAAEARQRPISMASALVIPVVLQKEVPKVDGVSSRKNWTFRIRDEAQIPREFLMPNEAAIRQVVRALKDKANIPGIEVYCEDSVAVRIS